MNIITLEFEIKTSPKIYVYLKRYINSGIKFKNCLSWEFNQTKEIKKVIEIEELYNFKLKQFDLFEEIWNNQFPKGKVKWNKETKKAYAKFMEEGKEWSEEEAKKYTNLGYRKRYMVNSFAMSNMRVYQEEDILIFTPAVNKVLGTSRVRANKIPENLKIRLVGYKKRIEEYKEFKPKYYKIKKYGDKLLILITGEYEEYTPKKRLEDTEEVIGIDTGIDKEATHILSNGEKYTTITKNIEKNKKKLERMQSTHDSLYDYKSNCKDNNQIHMEKEMRKLELRLQRQRKSRAIWIASEIKRKAKVVIMDDVKANTLFKLSKKNWNKCRGPQNTYLGFTEKWIKWIIEKNGKKFYKLEREKTTASTRVCNECKASDSFLKYKEINGIKNTLSIRKFNCPYCGKLLDRDVNAARNIRDWGYEDLVSNC